MASHFRNDERQEPNAVDTSFASVPMQEVPSEAVIAEDVVTTVDATALVADVPTSEVAAAQDGFAGAYTPAAAPSAVPVVPSAVPTPTPAPASVPSVAVVPEVASVAVPDVVPAEVPSVAPTPAPVASDVREVPSRQETYAPLRNDPAPSIAPGTQPTISLRNVTMIYPSQPNKPALEDITLDIYPGEFVFLVGHSGSGKSTFIRLLNREIRATKGEVIVAGKDLTKMRNRKVPYLRRQIGCVFQDFKLLPDKTTYENVAFALECIGKPRSVIKAQVPEVLRLVGLGDRMDSYPDQLSGGEQQRVSVARAMVNRPPLLICDEPTGNLDPAISLGIMKLLDRINRTGTTVVMATHDREMVDSMRRRVVALEAGRMVRDQERGGYGNYGVL